MDSISVTGLCKSLGDFTLDHVSFRVPQGRIVGFIGENGAGKSTTINLILNELIPDAGKIEVLGKSNLHCSSRNDVGVVFDECNFHDVFNARIVGKMLSGIFSSWNDKLYYDYLKKFKIPEKQPIGSFSKGMKMKLSIICALAHSPKLLILDEATTGLDPVVRDEILDLFLDFIQDESHAIFFSSHITSDIQKIADYVILIHQGKVIFEEQKDDLVYHYGILKCRRSEFASLSPDDYLISRQSNTGIECLVKDREMVKGKYKNMIVDNATLEEIMLFYIKGGIPCEG